ncbi:MAG: hypothetical protein ACRCYV_10290 [Aeromonas sp.]
MTNNIDSGRQANVLTPEEQQLLALVTQAIAEKKTPPRKEKEWDELRQFFSTLTPSELLDILLDELACQPDRWQRWLTQASQLRNGVTAASLKKIITRALPKKDIYRWDEVRRYFARAEDLLVDVWLDLDQLPLEAQWAVVLHASGRLNTALESIDDSGGFRFGIEGEVMERLTDLFAQLPWSEADKAQWLYQQCFVISPDIFPQPSAFTPTYASPEFIALCQENFERELSLSRPTGSYNFKCRALSHVLLDAAKQHNDWRGEIKIHSALADSCQDFIALGRRCLSHQCLEDAQSWLTRAEKATTQLYQQQNCHALAIDLQHARGHDAAAWLIAKADFALAPSFKAYETLCQRQQQLKANAPDLTIWIEQIFQQALTEQSQSLLRLAAAEGLILFYLLTDRLEAAEQTAKQHPPSATVSLRLADALLPIKAAAAIERYFAATETAIQQRNGSDYYPSVAILERLAAQLDPWPDAQAKFRTRLSALALQHKAKRNLLACLRQQLTGFYL